MPKGKKGMYSIERPRAKHNAEDFIEYNCMNPSCYAMWDKHKDIPPVELCPFCGSNDIHSQPSPPMLRFNDKVSEDGYYIGSDIYDQYRNPYC